MSKARVTKIGSRQDEAYRRILALISDGTLVEGDRLPSEAELSTRFGVSRPTVREALSRLRNAGVIAVRKGSGSFVQGGGDPDFGPIRSLDELRYCFQFRAALEGEAAACAARVGNKKAIAAIEEALSRLGRAIEQETGAIMPTSSFAPITTSTWRSRRLLRIRTSGAL